MLNLRIIECERRHPQPSTGPMGNPAKEREEEPYKPGSGVKDITRKLTKITSLGTQEHK